MLKSSLIAVPVTTIVILITGFLSELCCCASPLAAVLLGFAAGAMCVFVEKPTLKDRAVKRGAIAGAIAGLAALPAQVLGKSWSPWHWLEAGKWIFPFWPAGRQRDRGFVELGSERALRRLPVRADRRGDHGGDGSCGRSRMVPRLPEAGSGTGSRGGFAEFGAIDIASGTGAGLRKDGLGRPHHGRRGVRLYAADLDQLGVPGAAGRRDHGVDHRVLTGSLAKPRAAGRAAVFGGIAGLIASIGSIFGDIIGLLIRTFLIQTPQGINSMSEGFYETLGMANAYADTDARPKS